MTVPRSTKEEHAYRRHLKGDKTKDKDCPFCEMGPGHEQFVRETEHLKIVRNRVPYSLWDNQRVLEHLMIVPKLHTDKLGELGDAGAIDFIQLIDEYESAGYNVYARSVDSSNRSVKHQHTHIMKLDGKEVNFLFMLRKPWYFRLSK